MSEDEDDREPLVSGEEALEAGSAAFFTAVGEGAKVMVPAVAASAGWQALLAVALPLMGLAVAKGAYRLFSPRTALLAKGYTHAFGDDPERVRRHAQEHEDDTDYHETMFRTFRAMMDAAEPEVVETLGHMAGRYTIAKRKPDMLFRGLGRLLCDLEAGELDVFRELLRGVSAATEKNKERFIRVVIADQFSHEEVHQKTASSTSSTMHYVDIVRVLDSHDRETDLGQYPLATRFFALLKREGLAGTPSRKAEWDSEDRSGDDALQLSRDVFETILQFVCPVPTAP